MVVLWDMLKRRDEETLRYSLRPTWSGVYNKLKSLAFTNLSRLKELSPSRTMTLVAGLVAAATTSSTMVEFRRRQEWDHHSQSWCYYGASSRSWLLNLALSDEAELKRPNGGPCGGSPCTRPGTRPLERPTPERIPRAEGLKRRPTLLRTRMTSPRCRAAAAAPAAAALLDF
ncbi:hypothetical protein F5884DRAFT_554477 [Xylogone sp. PMI_703]|nr:hypothetical protein F5884DRAFT_554477 [Xylogone sp. PMI_703]